MQTFYWGVRPNLTEKASPNVNTIKFGDGYEQRQKKGINYDLRTYSVELVVLRDEAKIINEFLTHHGGVYPFLWNEPNRYRIIKVKCGNWSTTTDHKTAKITATFEEVVA